jgi:hypothetical protein
MTFGVMTDEQRKLAQQKRKEKREAGLSMYKTDWLDDGLWQELAKKYKIKLPQHHIAPSGIKLAKIAKQLGLEEGWEEKFFGIGTKNATSAIKKENTAQPDGKKYNLRCYVGMLLETKEK